MANSQEEKSDDQALLERIKERFTLASEAEADIRKLGIEDLKFRVGDQWPEDVKNARHQDNRPCLTINRLPQFLRQVTNDQRQNRPAIQVDPVDDEGDVETARVIQGLIRHIEYSSNAEIAYDTASDGQCTHGFGYFRIITDYCDPMSFDQDIKIKRIVNPFSVFMDPSYQEPDGSDSDWGLVVDDLSKLKFKTAFPDSDLAMSSDWESLGNQAPDWVNKDGVKVAEYFERTFKKKTLCLLSNGDVISKSELDENQLPDTITIESERETQIPTITWYKTNGVEILERTDWPGQWIPIIPVLGDEIYIEGKRILEGVIRHAKDSQRMYNYWATAETETIALAPRAPFIGVEGQFEGFEAQWKTANTRNHAFLEYKAKSIGGEPAPPPARNVYEPPVQAITSARMASAEDLKATTGIYDSSLGNRSNEESGVAIQRRNSQSQVSNFHYGDNFTRSLRHAGRVIIDLIPVIYDTPRAVRIIGDDGEQEVVAINKIFQKNGQDNIYQMNRGTYDVTVSTGPSYQTKRQEAVASMMSLTKAYPQIVALAGDLMVKNMDWPGAQEISDRLKKSLPPGMVDDDQNGQNPQIAQQQVAQARQMIQQLTQQLNHSNDIINTKKLELASKERIAAQQALTDLQVEFLKTDASHAQLAFKQEVLNIHKRLDLLGENAPIGTEVGAGPQGAAPQTQNQQPTGGSPPGPNMGV